MITAFAIRFVLFTAIFYFTYKLLFSRMSFFKTNRFVLLGIPVFSATIPLIAPAFSNLIVPSALTVQLPEIALSGAPQPELTSPTSINWLLIIYFTITGLFLLGLIRGILKGLNIVKNSTADGAVYFTNKSESPFTFFRSIIIPEDLRNHKDLPAIIKHEQIHVNQLHSWDNLYYGLLTGLSWFNPFMHLLAKELRQIHECLADEQALSTTSREEYAQLLLSSAFGSEINLSPMAMGTANPFFNSSLIKTRITMMYKQKTKQHFKWLYLALVPILAGMTLLSCDKAEEVQTETPPVEEKTAETIEFGQADSPPLFANCDANASKDEQAKCFKEGLMNYVIENFKYPEIAQKEGLEGKMFVEFTINENGETVDVKVVKWNFNQGMENEKIMDAETGKVLWEATLTPAIDEALKYAKSLVEGLPKLAPALKDGKKVSVKFTLPLNLKLD
jgi:hypothetical protein